MNPKSSVNTLNLMEKNPENYGFFSLCRWIDARYHARHDADMHPRDEDWRLDMHPRDECWRLEQYPSVAFAPSELESIKLRDGKIYIRQFGLGLLGPDGPMPLHLTELIRERKDEIQDEVLLNFINMFHHRWLTLFYRAWASAQAAAGLDHSHDERFSLYIAALIGNSRGEIMASALPWHARLAAAGHLVMRSHNAAALEASLCHFFALPVKVYEYTFHWLSLPISERSALGGRNALLAETAVLGGHIADRQCNFLLDVGPLSLARYEDFLPEGRALPLLIEWVRAFVGLELHWTLQLNLHHDEVPKARLGGREQLGRTIWLSSPEGVEMVKGMVYTPETRHFQREEI